MTVFQLTQHSYRRLAQSNSSLHQSIREPNISLDSGSYNHDFDYRQTLHMECGVVALEPPPSYTVAMKELDQQLKEAKTDTSMEEMAEKSERSKDTEDSTDDTPGSNTETFSQYTETDRAGLHGRAWDHHRMTPGRNRDFIQLNVLSSARQAILTSNET